MIMALFCFSNPICRLISSHVGIIVLHFYIRPSLGNRPQLSKLAAGRLLRQSVERLIINPLLRHSSLLRRNRSCCLVLNQRELKFSCFSFLGSSLVGSSIEPAASSAEASVSAATSSCTHPSAHVAGSVLVLHHHSHVRIFEVTGRSSVWKWLL